MEPQQQLQQINSNLYRKRKYGVCQNADELHTLLPGLVNSIAESDHPQERKALSQVFMMHFPDAELLDEGLR